MERCAGEYPPTTVDEELQLRLGKKLVAEREAFTGFPFFSERYPNNLPY
jgi:hypothetical protein